MILSYTARLLCLCGVTYLVVSLLVSFGVSLCSSGTVRFCSRFSARDAARILLALRLAPACVAALLVICVCIPSYVWLEPRAAQEDVSVLCVALGVTGFLLAGTGAFRAAKALSRSRQYTAECEDIGRPLLVPGAMGPVWIIDGGGPIVALAGVFRPRFVLSRAVLEQLTREELSVVLSHERAHLASHDNVKRLLMLLSPGIPVLTRSFETLEREWRKFAEWAADDEASECDPGRALVLAGALLQVARVRGPGKWSPATVSLFTGDEDLRERVDRLLNPQRASPKRLTVFPRGATGWAAAWLLAVLALTPSALRSAYTLLEKIVN